MIHSLYIHIPFCLKKCIYFDFLSVPYDEKLVPGYMTALMNELDLRKESAGELRTVYIGGGTPTTVPTPALAGLLKKIRETFTVAADAEITIEANPGTIDKEKILALAGSGVNRFSIGVQSFDDDTLKLLGRIHTLEDVLRAVSAMHRANVGNLSIDLIYGIPGESAEDWTRNVKMAIELSPEHISAYELTPEGGTPLCDLLQNGTLAKPGEETIVGMYYDAIERLALAGYRHYEISNFARPGHECRHNLNYWDRGQYLGIGAGAHSFIADRRIRNTSDIGRYIELLNAGDLAIEESTEISCEEAIKEFVFLGLRKTEGLGIREFSEDLGIDIVKASEDLIAGGMLIADHEHVRLTTRGLTVSNSIIAELLERLELK
ncbi:MAG TPA: radical SAM family heme chaperone HemW [Thermodesulfovibrionales bacterium]|nr:radical SAM family heme chaperone HemW [Thermodesulfovibrionales bacterium]